LGSVEKVNIAEKLALFEMTATESDRV